MEIQKPTSQVIPYMPIMSGLFAGLFHRMPGHFCGVTGGSPTLSSVLIVADKLYAFPFLVLTTEAFDQISLNVKTAAEGKGRLGIYADWNVKPYALVLDAGEIDTGATGDKVLTINQTLTPGLYWLVSIFNATPNVKASEVRGNNIFCLPTYSSIGSGGISTMYYTNQTYGELPAVHPAPVGSFGYNQGICLRRA